MEDTDMNWRKASYSSNGGANCVEVATDGIVLVRDTTDREGPLRGNEEASPLVVRGLASVVSGLRVGTGGFCPLLDTRKSRVEATRPHKRLTLSKFKSNRPCRQMRWTECRTRLLPAG